MRAGTQGPTRPSVYFSCLSLKWLQGPGLCSQASSRGSQRGYRGQCYSRSLEGGKDLRTTKSPCGTADARKQAPRASLPHRRRPGQLRERRGRGEGRRSPNAEAQVKPFREVETCTPFRWKNYEHPPPAGKQGEGAGCAGNPVRTRHPPLPGLPA